MLRRLPLCKQCNTDSIAPQFYKDRVHPGEAFRGLWADVMLYRLRETYLAQQNIDRSSIPPHGLRNDPST